MVCRIKDGECFTLYFGEIKMIARLKSLTAHDDFRRYGANTAWLFGEKILRMIVGLPSPEYQYTFGALQVTFRKNETAQENTREQIVTLLKENPKYTKNDLMRILNKADGTIKEHLANLKNEDILKRVGSTKNGYWEVKQ